MRTKLNAIGEVIAVCAYESHAFSKLQRNKINLLKGLGIEGDAHSGKNVKHRSRVAANPKQANLRQVHLIHKELLDELIGRGFDVGPGIMGENILTSGLDLLALPRNTELHIGEEAIVVVTGLRNPCRQMDDYQAGLMSAVLDRDESGCLIRKAGIMGIVLRGGSVAVSDVIRAKLPYGVHHCLEPV